MGWFASKAFFLKLIANEYGQDVANILEKLIEKEERL
jgi:hypothetical protein